MIGISAHPPVRNRGGAMDDERGERQQTDGRTASPQVETVRDGGSGREGGAAVIGKSGRTTAASIFLN